MNNNNNINNANNGNNNNDNWNVVVNHEDQYSIWPSNRNLPNGWHNVGSNDSRDNCLNRIEALWTDMRPRSLRVLMNSSNGR